MTLSDIYRFATAFLLVIAVTLAAAVLGAPLTTGAFASAIAAAAAVTALMVVRSMPRDGATEIRRLAAKLEEAACWFDGYASNHLEKSKAAVRTDMTRADDALAKAVVNVTRAQDLRDAAKAARDSVS